MLLITVQPLHKVQDLTSPIGPTEHSIKPMLDDLDIDNAEVEDATDPIERLIWTSLRTTVTPCGVLFLAFLAWSTNEYAEYMGGPGSNDVARFFARPRAPVAVIARGLQLMYAEFITSIRIRGVAAYRRVRTSHMARRVLFSILCQYDAFVDIHCVIMDLIHTIIGADIDEHVTNVETALASHGAFKHLEPGSGYDCPDHLRKKFSSWEKQAEHKPNTLETVERVGNDLLIGGQLPPPYYSEPEGWDLDPVVDTTWDGLNELVKYWDDGCPPCTLR